MTYQRTQIYLEPDDHRRLLEEARARGISLASLLREIVARHLQQKGTPVQKSFDALIGIVDAPGSTDVARDRMAYRSEALETRYRRKMGVAARAAEESPGPRPRRSKSGAKK